MADGRKNNKGTIGNKGGRKPKADEDKARERLLAALKLKYKRAEDEDNIVKFLSEFLDSKEGLKFFAEHLIGKPKEKIQAEVKQSLINWVEEKTYEANDKADQSD